MPGMRLSCFRLAYPYLITSSQLLIRWEAWVDVRLDGNSFMALHADAASSTDGTSYALDIIILAA